MNTVFKNFVIMLFCSAFAMFYCANVSAYGIDGNQNIGETSRKQTGPACKNFVVLFSSFASCLLYIDTSNNQSSDTDKVLSGSDFLFFSNERENNSNIFPRYTKVSSLYRQLSLFSQRYLSRYYTYGLEKIIV